MSCSEDVVSIVGPPAVRLREMWRMARDGSREPRIQELALQLRRDDPVRSLWGVLEFVQALPYIPDPTGRADRVRAPCRVVDLGGDCEDLAIAAVALDLALGLGARLVWLPQSGAQDHVSAQAFAEGRWWWQEPTLPGARLGEHPFRAAGRLGRGTEL